MIYNEIETLEDNNGKEAYCCHVVFRPPQLVDRVKVFHRETGGSTLGALRQVLLP